MTRNLSIMSRVSSLAIAAVLTAGAAAQSFLGTPSVASGDAFVLEGAGLTNVNVNSTQAVIDWTPDDNVVGGGAIDFQPAGTTANFTGFQDFAVLNRINVADPGRVVMLNGTINSLIGQSVGGAIYFYSPSGFLVGATAAINVGSLVLSASPITVTDGSFISNGTVTFGQAPNPTATIATLGKSQINAFGAGSYVAMVAPRVSHQGVIRTDGAAALVAAEAATITFSPDSLFDIQVTVGTDDPNGIAIDGGIITRNSAVEELGNVHRAYLVAVAKNDAVTMVINNGGSVGFDTATSATVEDNAVILSGGGSIFNGTPFVSGSALPVNLSIDGATFSSDVHAEVSGSADIRTSSRNTSFGNDLTLFAGDDSIITAINGNTLAIGGTLLANVDEFGTAPTTVGNQLQVTASGAGSALTVGGDVTLSAAAFGADDGEGINGGHATGGTVILQAGSGGTVDIVGDVGINADGYGGDVFFNEAAGNGTGGVANILADGVGGSSLSVGGTVNVSASGHGGSTVECSSCQITGGDGTGGSVTVHAAGGGNQMDLLGDVTITAAGQGGAGDAQAGDGFGGTASLGAFDGSTVTIGQFEGSTVTISADTEVIADGFGGFGFDNVGGLGRGGTASIGTNGGGSIDLTGAVSVTANGKGGSGSVLGGTGTGGIAHISAFLGTIHAFNNVSVSAHSSGGSAFGSGTGGDGLADIETATTPAMTEASLFAGGGTLTVDGLTIVSAGATGGNGGFEGGDGGNAVAAGVAGTINGGAIIHAGNSDAGPSVIQLGGVTVAAEASGGAGGNGQGGVNGSDGGNGGSATGGKAVITAAAGSGDLTAGATFISASAGGGHGGSGGGGDGGSGGNGGDGGNATGGFINVGTESGDVNFAQGSNDGVATYASILSFANASGGNGGNAGFGAPAGVAGDGGDAIGGDNVLLVRGSIVNVGNVNLVSNANGGNGGFNPNESQGGVGGDAITGTVGVLVTNRFLLPNQRGTLNAGAITGNALATGGAGAIGGGQWTRGGTFFEVVNSDATIASVNLLVGADGVDPGATETFASYVAVVGSTVDVAGGFNLQSPGRVSVHVGDSTPLTTALTAGSFTISADTFVHDENRPLPAMVGTISADSIGLGTSGDLIVDAHLISTSALGLSAPGLVDIENATSGEFLIVGAGSTITGGNLAAAEYVSVGATGDINLNLIQAGDYINFLSFEGAANSNGMSAGDHIFVSGATGVSVGDLTATNDITATSGGNVAIGDATSTAGDIFFEAGDGISTGALSALGSIFLDAFGDITFGDAEGDEVEFDGGGAVTGGNIIAGTQVYGEAAGAVTLGNISVGIQQTGGPADDGFAVGLVSATSISVGDVEADEAIGFATFGNLNAGNLDAGTDVLTLVGGNTTIASITTAATGRTYHGDAQMFIDAGGPDDFVPGLVFAETPVASGGSYTVTGPISTGRLQVAAASINTAAITAPIGIYLQSVNGTATGDLSTNGGADLLSGGAIQTGDIQAGTSLFGRAAGAFSSGDIAAGSFIDVRSGGLMQLGALSAGGFIDLRSNSNIGIGDAASGETINFLTQGSVTGGDLTAGDSILAQAMGTASFGNLSAGIVNPSENPNAAYAVRLAPAGALSTGSINAAGDIGLYSQATLTTGNLTTGTGLLVMVDGDISTGAITTPGDGYVYIADDSMAALGGTFDNFDRSAVLAATPVATSGSISINGPVSTSLLQAAAGTNFSALGIAAASDIQVSAGGTIGVGGAWNSGGHVELTSNDIDIGASGSIDGSELDLISTNATQTVVGDGIAGGGYQLSDAEFNRLRSNDIDVIADGGLGAAPRILLGDLNVNASADEGANDYEFVAQGSEGVGSIRILGEMNFTGMGADDAVTFTTNRFELDAATGLLSLESAPGTLGGTLFLDAAQIHVASGDILDQLVLDPQYDGYQDDLNAPAAIQRPDGVIRAGSIEIEFADGGESPLNTLYVQNTGTADTPAGFLVGEAVLFGEGSEAIPSPGSIDVIINGQIVTDGGTLTGVEVRDALVEAEGDLTPFTANSTINGCLLVGACDAPEPESPFPPGFTPTPGIQDEIRLIGNNLLPPPPFGNEDFIDDNDEETNDNSTSPIQPPNPLFNTSELGGPGGAAGPVVGTPMRSTPGLTDDGDIDDPVSGGGNPALIEVPPAPSSNQEKQP